MKKTLAIVIGYFLKGLLYTVPLAITVYVIYNLFMFFDRLIILPYDYDFPGFGILFLFFFITLMGLIGSSVIVQPISRRVLAFIEKTPFLKTIYSAVKDIVSTFVEKKSSFRVPVLVKISSDSNLEKIGFITEEDLSGLGIKDGNKIAVYFPHSYAFSGNLLIVDRKNVNVIDQKSADVMKFIVSGGVAHLDPNSKGSDDE